jgi:hypothetical protein
MVGLGKQQVVYLRLLCCMDNVLVNVIGIRRAGS